MVLAAACDLPLLLLRGLRPSAPQTQTQRGFYTEEGCYKGHASNYISTHPSHGGMMVMMMMMMIVL
jgi:hypothetical protein